MEQDTNLPPEQEPTVLDLFKSVTKDWTSFFNFIRSSWDARRREEFNQTLVQETAHPVAVEQVVELSRASTFPWRAMFALVLALSGQFLVEPPNRLGMVAFALYLAAFGLALWSFRADEWRLPALPAFWQSIDPFTLKIIPLLLAVALAAVAFVDFGNGLFSWLNLFVWLLSLLMLGYSLWIKTTKLPKDEVIVEPVAEPSQRIWQWNGVTIAMTEETLKKILWGVLVVAVFGVAVFFRLHQLDVVPNEPFSDHAEKIVDVYEITQDQPRIFFERNTGREAIQMYWTLLVLNIFGTGFSYLSLKLGTVLLGILTLPYVYWLGREYGNARVALFALFLFGIAYWPNVISRIGLRFPLYPLFLAPTLYYLTRGLRMQNRNDFILAGIFLGLGLHGYSPFRMVPIFVVVLFFIYFLHSRTNEDRRQTVWWLLIVVIVSLFVFLPLLRYWMENPTHFGYRALTRLSDMETALPGPAWQIFLSNLYKGLLMFNWDDGDIWVHSVTHRPALDLVTASLFALGVFLLVVRYIRRRDWRDMLLLVSIPVLIMPSVLSLAFPGENPSLNRTGAAAVPVILIGAVALDWFVSAFGSERKRQFIGYGVTLALLASSAYFNYNLVFDQFRESYTRSTWNTSELAKVLGDFRDKHGQLDTAWIVPFPHWVDTRLPGVWLGIPNRDFAMWRDQLPGTLDYPAPKLFMFWNLDAETENVLRELYPQGKLSRYTSAVEGKRISFFTVEP